MYPKGARSAPPCARMPASGFYFDSITRQEPIDEAHLDPADNLEEFAAVDDEALEHVRREVERLGATGRALLGEFGGTSFGDAAFVTGPTLAHPRGIRDLEQWYMSLVSQPEYIKEVFERQCEIGLANLQRIHGVVGDSLSAVFITGTDFGSQGGPMIGPKTYRALFQPVHARINDWIHTHTSWKTFIHSCGSIWRLLDDLADAGFDALNPVQTSATDMTPQALKERYGDRITFWGGPSMATPTTSRPSACCPSARRRTCAPWSERGCRSSAPAVASCSTRSTTSRPASRWRTSLPCTRQ